MALCWPGTVPHVHPANNIEVGCHIGQSHPLAHAKCCWLSTNEIIRQDSYTNNMGCIRKATRLRDHVTSLHFQGTVG